MKRIFIFLITLLSFSISNMAQSVEQTYEDGRVYIGTMKDGKFHGEGTLTLPNGKKYVGTFKDGLFNGKGSMIFPDGNKLDGNWRQGHFNGKGKLQEVNGQYRENVSSICDYLKKNGVEYSNLDIVPYWDWVCSSYEYDLSYLDDQNLTQLERNLLGRYKKVIIEKHTPYFYYVIDNEDNVGIYNMDGTLFCPPVPGRMIIIGGGFTFMLVGDCTEPDVFQEKIISFCYGKGIPAGECVAVINHKKGEWIIPFGEYVNIMIARKATNTHYYVSKFDDHGELKWGILDNKANIEVPCEYRSVGLSGDGYFMGIATGKYSGSNDHDMYERIANREASLNLYNSRRNLIASYAFALGSALQTTAQYIPSNGYSETAHNDKISNSSDGFRNVSADKNVNTTAYNQDRRTYSKCETLLINMSTSTSYSYSDNERISTQQQMRSIRNKWESRGLSITKSSWEDWGGK